MERRDTMQFPTPMTNSDPLVSVQQRDVFEQFGEDAFLGNWFVFLKATSDVENRTESQILFRGREKLTLPGVEIQPKPMPHTALVSLTSDKTLYHANRDRVRLLIACPTEARQEKLLTISLSDTVYGEYPVMLDEFGLCLYPLQDLPEGQYVATLVNHPTHECRFEVAEYRLAPLSAELIMQEMDGTTLRYTLALTTFNQPYHGAVDVELQERGQRIGTRSRLQCSDDGRCSGIVELSGTGPYTLNVIAGERTATVVLKGSEQERRERLTISELGELYTLSLLPSAGSRECRGLYVARGGSNTEPFVVRNLIGNAVEITPRVAVEAIRVVTVNPTRGTSGEKYYEQLKPEQSIQVPVPPPYGIILLGAFIDGQAWEGWCTVLRPSALQVTCEVPKETRPGSRVTVTVKTNVADRVVPVQLIVKDARLIAQSDPQVEFAACIKANCGEWASQATTGIVDKQLSQVNKPRPLLYRRAMPFGTAQAVMRPMMAAGTQEISPMVAPMGAMNMPVLEDAVPSAQLTPVRLSFPEVVYNNIVKVRSEASVEVKLGDGMTNYTIEAFALSPETLDWQRTETTLTAIQDVYGELTVSPFVFSGDSVIGRLDVGASSGYAIVEVQHNGEVLPLFADDDTPLSVGEQVASGSIVRFPVRPGTITAIVRDIQTGKSDVSERYVTEPGQLRHIVRSLRLLAQGEGVTLEDMHALELRPLPGLDRPFTVLVEAASLYPYGCVEQTSTKLVAMYVGYITSQYNEQRASEYEAAIQAWYKRLASMYLPQHGFCLYPPQEGFDSKPDMHYAPLAVKRLLDLPEGEQLSVKSAALLEILREIRSMASDAAQYYAIENPQRTLSNCHDAYCIVSASTTSQSAKDEAIAFVRSRLREYNGVVSVPVAEQDSLYQFLGSGVASRQETAYAASVLLQAGEDMPLAIAATNTVTGQLNEAGCLYSTVDTAACLALMLALRNAGVVVDNGNGRVALNGQEMSLAEALNFHGNVESIQCMQGVVAAQITSEVIEDWRTFSSQLAVEVRLEKQGQQQEQFALGDELDLVMRVRQYEPGLLAHVCLPDALARIVGGGQVKRFSLDFRGQNELRIPLAAISTTGQGKSGQHWAVIVRNMFKEEQVGNPGLLEVKINNS